MTSPQAAEAAGAIMTNLRTGGLVEERLSARLVRLRCYLPPSRLLSVTLRALRLEIRALARFGLDPGPARVTRRLVPARRWATAWRQYVRPVRVGRLYVKPSWIPAPRSAPRPSGLTVIAIDPGMAFGTGSHPTTRLCLGVLQDYVARRALGACPPLWGTTRRRTQGEGPVVFDVGTGSGILAIAAARLGAARVWAVDEDPAAVAVARENARQNGVASRVRVVRGTGLDRAPGRADLVLANLIAEAIIPMLGHVSRHLVPRGIFVGSGITAGHLHAVERAAWTAGLRRLRVLAQGEWRAVVLAARGAATSASKPRRRTR